MHCQLEHNCTGYIRSKFYILPGPHHGTVTVTCLICGTLQALNLQISLSQQASKQHCNLKLDLEYCQAPAQ